MSHKDYKAVIKPFLSEKRYRHSLAVAEEAVRMRRKPIQREFCTTS